MLSNKYSIPSGTPVSFLTLVLQWSYCCQPVTWFLNVLINVSTLLHFLLATTTIYYCRVLYASAFSGQSSLNLATWQSHIAWKL